MALTDENGGSMVMPVTPMGNGANGFDGFGGGGWWILLLFILLGNGGWGGFGGFGGNAMADMYPWMNQSNQINNGFRDQMLNSSVDAVQAGIAGINNQLCNGFAGVNAGVANGFAQAEIAANGRQMANMNQAFAAQTAMSQGFNQISSQFANCCCENRLGTADLKYTIATENCADRAAVSDGIRDVVTAGTANTQAVLNAIKGISDQMCQDKIDAKNERIADLERQLTLANLAASQSAQTAAIQAGQRALANEVEQYVLPTPRPAYIVQNPNCCTQGGCGSF